MFSPFSPIICTLTDVLYQVNHEITHTIVMAPYYSCCALINKSFPTAINMVKLIFYTFRVGVGVRMSILNTFYSYLTFSTSQNTPSIAFHAYHHSHFSMRKKAGMKMRAVNNNNNTP